MNSAIHEALRSLPAVHEVLQDSALADVARSVQPALLTALVRDELDNARHTILAGHVVTPDQIVENVVDAATLMLAPRSDIVVNGTGVIIHTNLGRAPVSRETAVAMAKHSERYQALELRLDSGKRGGRGEEVSRLMQALTGAEKTLVVNNNAAAVLLTLAALTAGKEVVVSRGEAVEIGGGFRIPDVMQQSGATLREVGTTNRTYASDYEQATGGQTAAYLKVHASNFAISGFTASATLQELAQLASQRNVLLIEDVGSGCLLDTRQFGLQYEPTLGESIAAGVDAVCASGDKLLGGPQAGIISGKSAVVDRIAKHPLARAVRADKSSLAGLAATLRHYVTGEATSKIPVWWAMSRECDWLQARCERWAATIDHSAVQVISSESVVGGGSLPGRTQPSWALAVTVAGVTTDELARRLRTGTVAIMPRIINDQVAIDARSVLQDEDDLVVQALQEILR